MDKPFFACNTHKQDPERFRELDPHLSSLKQLRFIHTPALLQQLPTIEAGLYTLTGGCLTGKTTLLKLWMEKLLAEKNAADAITFFSGELIENHEHLIRLLKDQLHNKTSETMRYVMIDDVTRIRDWEKGIQFATDAGFLNQTIMLLTSSHKLFYQNKIAIKNNFHLSPLNFHEVVRLKQPNSDVTEIDFFKEFDTYLLHGGYLTAINDVAIHGKILDGTLKLYSESLQKNILLQGRQKNFLQEILSAIITHYYRPVTWNMLSREVSINHPTTISDYVFLLESLDAIFIQSALIEEKLIAAPKKARKLIFTDPFIFHALRASLHTAEKNIFSSQINPALENIVTYDQLVKTSAINYYQRYYPTYYIKGEGEIDLAYINENRFWPVIIAWVNEFRVKDLKQILKYPNGKILTKSLRSGIIEHVRTEPLPQALWKLEERQRKK